MLRFGGCLSKAGNLTTSLGSLWNIFNKRHQETGRETKSSEWQWQLKRKNEWVWEFLMNPCIKRSYAKASFNTNYGQRYENVITSVHKITKDMGVWRKYFNKVLYHGIKDRCNFPEMLQMSNWFPPCARQKRSS